jgi:hypothetical protein
MIFQETRDTLLASAPNIIKAKCGAEEEKFHVSYASGPICVALVSFFVWAGARAHVGLAMKEAAVYIVCEAS